MLHNRRYVVARGLVALALSAIAAACGGGGGTVTQPTPPAPTLTSLAVTPATVLGGAMATVTATLSGVAPSTGAAVSLSSNNAAVTVPSTLAVAAGATTGTAQVTTASVTAAASATITGSISGSTQSATVALEPAPVARFTVVSPTDGNDACRLGANAAPDCTMNGSASTGSGAIQLWTWTFKVGPDAASQTTNTPTTQIQPGCTLFSRQPATTVGNTTFIQMIVELVVRDAAGRSSAPAVNPNVRVFPRQQCGRGF